MIRDSGADAQLEATDGGSLESNGEDDAAAPYESCAPSIPLLRTILLEPAFVTSLGHGSPLAQARADEQVALDDRPCRGALRLRRLLAEQ
jgi:hypothetical protein